VHHTPSLQVRNQWDRRVYKCVARQEGADSYLDWTLRVYLYDEATADWSSLAFEGEMFATRPDSWVNPTPPSTPDEVGYQPTSVRGQTPPIGPVAVCKHGEMHTAIPSCNTPPHNPLTFAICALYLSIPLASGPTSVAPSVHVHAPLLQTPRPEGEQGQTFIPPSPP
jgi:hypothetical protein